MESLNKDSFIKKVFNFELNKEWKFEGTKPCVIDFYADWCGPCKMVAPIMEELSKEYDGKVDIYKIDSDEQQELSALFGIRSIPTVLFCPVGSNPQIAVGALPKEAYMQAIEEVLGVPKPIIIAN